MKTRSLTALAVFGVCITVLAEQRIPPQPAPATQPQMRKTDAAPIDLSGPWKGAWGEDPSLKVVDLTLTRGADPRQFTGEMRITRVDPPSGRAGKPPEGTCSVTVMVDPGAATVYLAPGAWITPLPAENPPNAMAAVYSAKRDELAGRFQPHNGASPNLPYFVLVRGDAGAAAINKLTDHVKEAMVPYRTPVRHPAGANRPAPVDRRPGRARPGQPPAEPAEQPGAPATPAPAAPSDEALVQWISKLGQEYADPTNKGSGPKDEQTIPLLADAAFKPAFGETYDALDVKPLNEAIHSFRTPALNAKYGYGEYVLKPEPSKFVEVGVMRTVDAWQSESVERFRDHPLSATAFPDIEATQQAATKQVTLAWPSERKTASEALEQLKPKLAGPALAASVEHALASPSDLDSAKALAVWTKDNASVFAYVTPAQQSSAQQKVDAMLDEVLTALLKPKVDALAGLGSGMTAVRNGAAWYKSLAEQYGFALARPPVQNAVAKLSARREADLKSAQDELTRTINGATKVEAIDQLFATDLSVPTDHTCAAGKDLFAVADKQKMHLMEQELLALFSPEERALMDRPGHIDLTKAKPRPPTAEEIRLALVRGYAAGNDGKVLDAHTCRHVSLQDSAGVADVALGIPYPMIITFSDEKLISTDPVEKEPGVYDCQYQVVMAFKVADDNVLANFTPETRQMIDQMGGVAAALSRLGRESNDVKRRKFCLYEDGWGCPELRQAGEVDQWFYRRFQSPHMNR